MCQKRNGREASAIWKMEEVLGVLEEWLGWIKRVQVRSGCCELFMLR